MKPLSMFVVCILLLTGFFSDHARAQSFSKFGLGAMIGSPTGISAQAVKGNGHAVDAGLGWSLEGRTHVHFHSDYLWNRPRTLQIDGKFLNLFFGAGGRLQVTEAIGKNEPELNLGVRGPVGLSYMFQKPSIEIFGETALVINLIEETSVDLDLAVGARYFF